jgi:hypothetical protein
VYDTSSIVVGPVSDLPNILFNETMGSPRKCRLANI